MPDPGVGPGFYSFLRNGTDRNGLTKIPKRTSRTTGTGLNKGRVWRGRTGQDTAGVGRYLLCTSTSYGVYISQLIRFARVSSHVVDFNARNKSLTAKLLQQGYRYHKLRKTFSKFYRRHYELVSKFNVGLKTLLHQGLSEPEFYGDLVYKFKKNCR